MFQIKQNGENFANGVCLFPMQTGVVFDAGIQKSSVVLHKPTDNDFQRVTILVHI